RFEFGFELLEGELERSGTLGLDVFGGNLELAAVFVDGDASSNHDLEAIGRTEAKQTGGGTEHHGADLGVAVFEREVKVSGLGSAEVGNFSFDPGVGVLALDMRSDGGDQVADFPYTAVGGAKVKAHLVGERGHSGQCKPEIRSPQGTQGKSGIPRLRGIPW